MFARFFLLALTLGSAVANPVARKTHHVIGTGKASIKIFSYQASLIYHSSFICGAAVISPQWVITTARCADVEEKNFLFVSVGNETIGTREKMIDVTEIILHPEYAKHNHDFDFALLKVSTPFDKLLPHKIKPIALAHSNAGIHPGAKANVTGWGTAKGKHGQAEKSLRYTSVTILPQHDCKHIRHKITHNMFCAENPKSHKSSCQGDTGGPLVIHGKLHGLVSWGQQCDTSEKPVVYARVSQVAKWIRKHVDDFVPYSRKVEET